MTFFEELAPNLNLVGNGQSTWRKPQLGAIGALLKSFSLDDQEPPLVSMPTGTGKTAIAMIAPHLMSPSPRRVLIIEPSVELRRQVAEEAKRQSVLQQVGCFPMDARRPSVLELKGRVKDWSDITKADFVVAHPNSISPSHYEESPPPTDLFDLVIVDEAHHLPAPTWQTILGHFEDARAILLTATPFRRDRKKIPGQIVYHYPLSRAIAEGIYHPVVPELLHVEAGEKRSSIDERIAIRAVELLATAEHATSAMLIPRGIGPARQGTRGALRWARNPPRGSPQSPRRQAQDWHHRESSVRQNSSGRSGRDARRGIRSPQTAHCCLSRQAPLNTVDHPADWAACACPQRLPTTVNSHNCKGSRCIPAST